MSRLFNGSSDNHVYNLPASGTGPVNHTFGTELIVARFVTSATWASLIEMEHTSDGSERAGIIRDNAGALCGLDGTGLVRSTDAGTGTSFTIGTGDNWVLLYRTKATGTASPTLGKIPVATGTHTSRTTTATQGNYTQLGSGRIRIAGDDDWANIRVAVAAVLPGVVLTSGQLDAIVAAKTTQSILDVAPADGWVVDDSDGLTNNLVAANTNLSSGTSTDDADDPAGWTYFGGGGSVWPPVDNPAAPPLRLTRSTLRLG